MNVWRDAEEVFDRMAEALHQALVTAADQPSVRVVRVVKAGLGPRVAALVTGAFETFKPPLSGASFRIERTAMPDGTSTLTVSYVYPPLGAELP